MEWRQLLSEKRRGNYARARDRKHDLRSEFEKDYHRIIGSASFRRLQDKTQVFPLDRSDFIRTRLTHSLEVSSFGRSLAENISASIMTRGVDPAFSYETKEAICEILQCAGLIHDIGNPPFGHFGEESIREWFASHLDTLLYHGRPVSDILGEQEKKDLLNYDGNAQGLRLVSRLHFLVNENGMNLTYGLLSAVMKYPVSSLEINKSASDKKYHKAGYFKSEEELFRDIQKTCGTHGCRSPLAYILEAADDIAYATADIEDAFKKGFLTYQDLLRELKARGVTAYYTSKLEDAYRMGEAMKAGNPEEYAVMNALVAFQGSLLHSATEGFMSHYQVIMKGGYPYDLFYHTPAEKLLAALKSIAYDYAFTTASIFRTEIAANTILTYLMDHLVSAALSYDEGRYPGLLEEKFLSLISENYREVYHRMSAGADEAGRLYLKLLLATDCISGMTDSYARDLYHELTGSGALR